MLKQILEEYRNSERGLPTYEELQRIQSADEKKSRRRVQFLAPAFILVCVIGFLLGALIVNWADSALLEDMAHSHRFTKDEDAQIVIRCAVDNVFNSGANCEQESGFPHLAIRVHTDYIGKTTSPPSQTSSSKDTPGYTFVRPGLYQLRDNPTHYLGYYTKKAPPALYCDADSWRAVNAMNEETIKTQKLIIDTQADTLTLSMGLLKECTNKTRTKTPGSITLPTWTNNVPGFDHVPPETKADLSKEDGHDKTISFSFKIQGFWKGIDHMREKNAPHHADVVVDIDGHAREFTASDFLARLGFDEFIQQRNGNTFTSTWHSRSNATTENLLDGNRITVGSIEDCPSLSEPYPSLEYRAEPVNKLATGFYFKMTRLHDLAEHLRCSRKHDAPDIVIENDGERKEFTADEYLQKLGFGKKLMADVNAKFAKCPVLSDEHHLLHSHLYAGDGEAFFPSIEGLTVSDLNYKEIRDCGEMTK